MNLLRSFPFFSYLNFPTFLVEADALVLHFQQVLHQRVAARNM